MKPNAELDSTPPAPRPDVRFVLSPQDEARIRSEIDPALLTAAPQHPIAELPPTKSTVAPSWPLEGDRLITDISSEPVTTPSNRRIGAVLMRGYATLVILASIGILAAQVVAGSTDNGVTTTAQPATYFSFVDGLTWLGGILGLLGGLGLLALQRWARRILIVLHFLLSIVFVPLSPLLAIAIAMAISNAPSNPLGAAIMLLLAAAWGLGFYFLHVPVAMKSARQE